ncbi:MAG TPA: nuclear transport factor 2 family protein [Chloroflexota bacterium]|nr:nuclear transport factor 2 family protein [Chloroflexota bacterium]
MTVDENKQVAERAFGALAARDFNRLESLLAPDAVLHQCGFLKPLPARALLQGELGGRSPIVEREVQLEQIIAEGDTVALRWRTTGRYADRDSPRLDGVRVSFPSMTFLRFADGRIAEIWNMRDADTLQSALREAGHE